MKICKEKLKNNPALARLVHEREHLAGEIRLIQSEIIELKEELRHKQQLIRTVNSDLIYKDHSESRLKLVSTSS